MSSEEWTFVTKSRRCNERHKKAAQDYKGLYHSMKSSDKCNTRAKGKEEILHAILECLLSLARQYQSEQGFAFRLIDALVHATTNGNDNELKSNSPNIQDMVVYGIGNFSLEFHSAPMCQMAGALFIRRVVSSAGAATSFDGLESTDIDAMRTLFQSDQQQTPIFYYEPCILPLEKELLEDVFCVYVLQNNNMGKLSVSKIRELFRLEAKQKDHESHTLFYMPHCPMRLYCNVLWAHWSHIVVSNQKQGGASIDINPILIFGNSFHAYDERTIASKHRIDSTNGMFRLVQFTNETPIYSEAENRSIDDSLKMLERAFNDCNLISFLIDQDATLEKPNEYIPSDNPYENGELL